MSELSQDFESLVVQVNAKVKEAAASLKEANDLLTKSGLPAMTYTGWRQEDEYSEIYKRLNKSAKFDNDHDLDAAVEEAMEARRAEFDRVETWDLELELRRAGWSTSTSYC